MRQIDCAMNRESIPDLQWVPEKTWWPPPHCNEEDTNLALLDVASAEKSDNEKYCPGTPHERKRVLKLINAKTVAKLKQNYAHETQGKETFVSTSDLIQAALAELAEDGFVMFYESMRDKDPDKQSFAGNHFRPIKLPVHEARNPQFVRSICKNWAWSEFATSPGTIMGCSNVMTLTSIEPLGTKVICQYWPFRREMGCDWNIVFKADNEGTIALISNCIAGKRGEDLHENMAGSKIYSKLFGTEAAGVEEAGEPGQPRHCSKL